jgi:hypothetical protein
MRRLTYSTSARFASGSTTIGTGARHVLSELLKLRSGVHWVSGLGNTPGRWAHSEPAPHGEPAV